MIRLRKAGHTYDEIAQQTGLTKTGVFNICKRHVEGGAKALKDAAAGRQVGQGRRLDLSQELNRPGFRGGELVRLRPLQSGSCDVQISYPLINTGMLARCLSRA
ncbi:hypothetical protein ACEQUB_p01390 (plasmid) [Ralstonia syzygii]